jgi:hypothetical protein
MPAGTVGAVYRTTVTVSGGSSPYAYSIHSGALPPGLGLDVHTGVISGKPQSAGAFSFVISVSDGSGQADGQQKFSISVRRPAPGTNALQVSIAPAAVTLLSGATQQFSAQVSNAGNSSVVWSASSGTITPTGLLTAPQTRSSVQITVTATSQADPSKYASAVVTVNAPVVPPAKLAISSASLPEATEGNPYAAGLSATGGTPPYRWALASGKWPAGILLDAATGAIDGTTSQTGAFPVTVSATDASGQTASRALSLSVIAGNAASTDGPAELPRVHVNSALSDTPAPGARIAVKTSAELQKALNSAQCGDTISLQAGTMFTGLFTFPAKPCDDAHWIVVRTSAADSALPPEGTRVTPCYAGTASLPGRPDLGCAGTSQALATVAFAGTGSGPLIFANGANHYRLLGLEITRTSTQAVIYNLVSNQNNGTSDHVVIDRCWLHGTAQDETTRGVMLAGATYVAVVDSFFTDFHCVAATGSCSDAQAIASGLGTNAMGPYKIVNNFLEASGENVLFGGGGADHTPEDIEIRHNHFFKPMIWQKGQPGFVGGRNGNPFVVKNHLELKNGARVLLEGNVLENTWGGFSQAGFSILLTPKNQDGQCPLCVVHDITIRYNSIAHAGAGLQIGNGASDSGALSLGMWNVSVHDVLMNDIDAHAYNGGGHLFQESNGNPVSVLHDVAITHVTALSKNPNVAMIIIGNSKTSPEMYGFTWTNNIFSAAAGIMTTGGGADNCAYQQSSAGVLTNCFQQWTFSHNVLVDAKGTWPSGNFAATVNQVKFASASRGLPLSQFMLPAASPFAGAGSDGKDPGVDVAGLAAALEGVP